MGIFADLPAKPGTIELKQAAFAVVQRLKTISVAHTNLRLGELGTAEEDFEWLSEWVWQLDEEAALSYLHFDAPLNSTEEHQRQRAMAGTLLLLYAAEYIRRGLPAAPGWCLPDAKAFPEAVSAKFWINGEPSPLYLWALGEAAKRLRLREVNGHSEISFLTFPLIALHQPALFNDFLLGQIGLTATQLTEELPNWVASNETPPPVSALLDETHGSKTFRQTWEALRAYHQAELNAEGLRLQLSQSPWILPAWTESLVEIIPIQPLPRGETIQAAATYTEPEIPAPEFVPIAAVQAANEAQPSLDVFGSLFPFGGVKTVMKALRVLSEHLENLKQQGRPFSLAELRLSDYDYIWLRVWVIQLEPYAVSYCQDNRKGFWAGSQKPSFQASLGLLLMLWLTETARREAVEGELWPYVAEGYFNPDAVEFNAEVYETLFTQGHASTDFREMLRAAVRQFNLRNVLDEPNVQRWLDTVFLQFGFTKRGFQQRLPEWLAGQATTRSVMALLDDKTGCAAFRTLWDELRDYRRGYLTESHLRETLAESPWVLPEWIEAVLAGATATISTAGAQAAAPAAVESFLTTPVLHWPSNGSPQFICQLLADVTHLDLSDSSYDVCLDGKVQAQLLRQEDESYLPVPTRFLTIPFDQPTATASLRTETGETVEECDLELWPPGEDVAVYRFPTGERLLDPFNQPLSNNVSYGLLLAADLTIQPAPAEWHLAASGKMKLHRLNARWAANTQVLLDDEVLWQPTLRQPAQPNWANVGVFLHDTESVKWNQGFRAKIIHHQTVIVRNVRCQGEAVEFTSLDQTTTLIGPLTINAEVDTRSLDFRIGLEKGGLRCTVRRTLNPNMIGVKHLHNGVWRILNKHSLLTVEQAKRDLFKIMFPSKWDGRDFKPNELAMIEGDSISHRRPAESGKLGSLLGWGAPVRLRPLFNAAPATFSLNIAGAVVNHGSLNEAIVESLPAGSARILRLSFNQPFEPTEQHSVIWWDVNGAVNSLAPKYWDEAEGKWWWVCDLPEECKQPLAIAIAHQGERQGAWWKDRAWLQPLSLLAEQDARRTAALLRWFQLPLLSAEAKAILLPIVNNHPIAYLRAWLLDEGLPDELEFTSANEAWRAVVRTLFHTWQPNAEQATEALMVLADAETESDLREYYSDAAKRLAQVDPLLMAKLFRCWQEPRKTQLLQRLRLEIAGCNSTAGINQAEQRLLGQLASDLEINTGLINTGILSRAVQFLNGNRIDETAERNLAVAARIANFRQLLALRLLAHI